MQLYVTPSKEGQTSAISEADRAQFHIDPSIPVVNVGAPVVVVGTKVDALIKQYGIDAVKPSGGLSVSATAAGDRLELLARQLRLTCLECTKVVRAVIQSYERGK